MLEQALSSTDVLDVCAVMLQRCGLSATQLAAHMGEPAAIAQPAPAVATAPRPRTAPPAEKPARDPDHLAPRQAQALDIAARAEGVTTPELQVMLGIASVTAFTLLDDLRTRGRVTGVKAPGIRAIRFFANPSHALAWLDSCIATATPQPAPTPAPAPKPKPAAAAPAPAPKPPPVDVKPVGEAVIPAGLVIQYGAPAVDTRLEIKPGEPLTGGFSAALPGINPMTGKAWGQ